MTTFTVRITNHFTLEILERSRFVTLESAFRWIRHICKAWEWNATDCTFEINPVRVG